MEDSFSMDKVGGERWFWAIQEHYVYCAVYFYHYYISSDSDHKALDPGGWEPLL